MATDLRWRTGSPLIASSGMASNSPGSRCLRLLCSTHPSRILHPRPESRRSMRRSPARRTCSPRATTGHPLSASRISARCPAAHPPCRIHMCPHGVVVKGRILLRRRTATHSSLRCGSEYDFRCIWSFWLVYIMWHRSHPVAFSFYISVLHYTPFIFNL